MLFDEKVIQLVEQHFVPVITDHPRGGTEPKRNPATWELCESWKRYPNSSEIVWLVSAGEDRRAGVVYSELKEPAELIAWMEAVLVFDGRIEKPSAEQVRRSVLVHMRAALDHLWRWREDGTPDRGFHDRRRAFAEAIEAVTDDELCAASEANALLARLRQPAAERRSELRSTLDRLTAVARKAGAGDTDWLRQLAAWHEADRLGSEAHQAAAVRLFRSWLRRAIESGALRPDDALAAELEALGVAAPDRDGRR